MSHPWDQRDDEPQFWFNRFTEFRLLPDRSIEETYRQWCRTAPPVRKPRPKRAGRTWGKMVKKFSWWDRADAWDRWLLEERLSRQKEEMDKMFERHIKIAMLIQNQAVQALQGVDVSKMTLNEISRVMDVATRIERMARGVHDEVGQIQYSAKLKDDQQPITLVNAAEAEDISKELAMIRETIAKRRAALLEAPIGKASEAVVDGSAIDTTPAPAKQEDVPNE